MRSSPTSGAEMSNHPVREQTTGTARNGEIRLPWERFTAQGEEPLLLINGLGGPMVEYEIGFIVELLERGFDVVRFDNRDAGRATATGGGYRLADMADDAVVVLDTVGWDTAHVFGMSMGGMIVQQLGIDHCDRLRSITSMASTTGNPEYGTASPAAQEANLRPMPPDREGWLDLMVATEQVWASPSAWSPEAARALGELVFDYGVQPEQTVHQYTAIMESGSREDALPSITTPTLVLHGSHDTLIHPSGGRRTAELIPDATYIELEGMGHDLPAAFWPTVADHVRALADQA